MSHKQHKLLVTSADHQIGKYLALMLASSEHMRTRMQIIAGGQDRSAMQELEREGIKVVEYDPTSRDDLQKNFKGCDGVLIIPPLKRHGGGGHDDEDDEDALAQEYAEYVRKCGRNMIDAAGHANIKCALLMSVYMSEKAGGGHERNRDHDDHDNYGKHGGKKEHIICAMHELEKHLEQSRIHSKCIVKHALLLETFIAVSPHVQSNGELPVAMRQGKFAPLSLCDLGKAVCMIVSGKKKHRDIRKRHVSTRDMRTWMRQIMMEIAAYPDEPDAATELVPASHRGKKYCLTGSELIDAHRLVDMASDAVGARIKLKEMDFEEYRRVLEESEMLSKGEASLQTELHCLIAKGAMAHVTKDYEHLVGEEPMRVADWFSDNAQHFQPQQ